ncbi:MAG: PAS domain-containing protein [Hydrogenophaga sp.]|nr:PAS domain-containing protein [Hydrogenophaga sp.]
MKHPAAPPHPLQDGHVRRDTGAPWFLNHAGECAALMRDAWNDPSTPWMQEAVHHPSIQAMLDLMLGADEPMFLAWGGERRMLYNDAYVPILGERHPSGMGAPMAQLWSDVWNQLEPLVNSVFNGGSVQMDDILLMLQRDGARREAHFTFGYHAVRDAEQRVMALYCVCREITGPQAEQQLRDQEAAMRWRLLSMVPGFVAILCGPQHRVTFVNRSFEAAFGPDPMMGRSLDDVIPAARRQGLTALMDRVLHTGERLERLHLPLTLPAPGGGTALRRYDLVLEPLHNHDPGVAGVFVQGQDVTDLYLAHELARSGNERQAALLDSMSESLLLLDPQLRVVQLNRAALAMDGRPSEALMRQTVLSLWGEAAQPVHRMLQDALASGEARHMEFRDSQRGRWLDLHAYPVPYGVALLYRDVSAVRQAETLLRESEARFRAAVSAVGVMWTCDAQGKMQGEQPGWQMLTGQRRDEYAGDGWLKALHPDDATEAIAQWRSAVRRGENYLSEQRVRRPGGPWREFIVRAVPLLTPDGRVREWVGVHIDVTDARQAARALNSAARRKDNFLAMLAHELRNPLAPIRTAAQALGHPRLTRKELDACQAVISRQVGHMAWLLNDLLDVSRISEGRLTLRRSCVGLRQVVDSAIETARPLLDDRSHQLTVDLPPQDLDIDVDPLRLAQVISNLLINAAKYTPPGGRVGLRVRAEPAGIVLEVADNGIGISEERLPHVFEMFSRISGQQVPGADGSMGMGIGLALARGLMELHGGTLEASSPGPGMGSTFTAWLPAAVSESAPAPLHDFGDLSNNPVRPGLRVLIADDNADAAESLAMLTSMEGHRVQVVHNGPDALTAGLEKAPDVCILDIGMPGMDGHTVARRLREALPEHPMLILAVTGWGQKKDKHEARAAGFDRHFTKPVDPNNLLAYIAEWQDRRATASETPASPAPHGHP